MCVCAGVCVCVRAGARACVRVQVCVGVWMGLTARTCRRDWDTGGGRHVEARCVGVCVWEGGEGGGGARGVVVVGAECEDMQAAGIRWPSSG